MNGRMLGVLVIALTAGLCSTWIRADEDEAPEFPHGEDEQWEHEEHDEDDEHWEREEHDEPELTEPEIIAFVEQHMPHMLQRLNRLRAVEPDEYHEHLREIAHHIAGYREMQEVAPEIAKALLRSRQVEQECHALAERIHETDDERERGELTTRLRAMLEEVFDLRLKRPELQIRRMEREIEEIRAAIEKRKENREAIVERRLQEMVGREDDALGWW